MTIRTYHKSREEAQDAVWDARRRGLPAFWEFYDHSETHGFVVHYAGGPDVDHVMHPKSPGVTCWCGQEHIDKEGHDG